jgi:hypothetical protein
MMWYSASLLFVSKREAESDDERLWEERIVLLEADDTAAALIVARDLGAAGEHSYAAGDGVTVVWQFDGVMKIYEMLNDPVAGAELFSRFVSAEVARRLKELA